MLASGELLSNAQGEPLASIGICWSPRCIREGRVRTPAAILTVRDAVMEGERR